MKLQESGRVCGRFLFAHAKSVIVSLATIVLILMVSSHLQANENLSRAVGWLGLDGRGEVVSPMWGELIRWAYTHLPGEAAFRLGVVSAIGGVVCVALLAFAAERFLLLVARRVESHAIEGEQVDLWPVRLGTVLSALGLLFAPPFFLAATRTGPLTIQLAIPFAALAVLALMTTVTNARMRAYLVAVAGFLAALGASEGAPGIVMFPILLSLSLFGFVRGSSRIPTVLGLFMLGAVGGGAFAMGDAFSVRHIVRSLSALVRMLPEDLAFPGCFILVIFVLLPLAAVMMLMWKRRLQTALVRRIFFGVWSLAILVLLIATFNSRPRTLGEAADGFVDCVLARLGTAKWIISDGTWDDFLVLKKPADVHLITFRREHDPAHARELLAWARAELNADSDLSFAAELGPTKFMTEWLSSSPNSATNCLFVMRMERELEGIRLRPAISGWRVERVGEPLAVEALAAVWRAEWSEFAPLIAQKDEPAADMLAYWFSVQGNAIGVLAAAEGKNALAWKLCYQAVNEAYSDNLSAWLNLGSILSAGHHPPAAEGQRVREQLNTRISALRTSDDIRLGFALGGRLYVDPKMREQVTKLRATLRQNEDSASTRQLLQEMVDEMEYLPWITGEAKREALVRIEATKIAALRTSQVEPWAKNLLLGDFAVHKGDPDSLAAGRAAYQAIIQEGKGEYRMAFERLLNLDWQVKNRDWLEYDALLVLRRDIRHQQANASLGMIQLEKGDYESAERFLQRALKTEGGPRASIKNDLALALSGLKRHDEAIRLIAEVVAEKPDNWNFLDSQATILSAACQKEAAEVARQKAREIARDQNAMKAYGSLRDAADRHDLELRREK